MCVSFNYFTADEVGDKAMKLQNLAKPQPQDSDTPDSEKGVARHHQGLQGSVRLNKKVAVSYHNGYVNGDIVMDEPTQITTVSQTCDSPLSLKTTNGIMLNTLNVEPTNVEPTNVEPTSTPHPESDNAQNAENTHDMQNTKADSEHPNNEQRPNGNGLTEGTNNVNGATNGGATNGGATNGGVIANGVDQPFEKSTEVLTENMAAYNVEGGASPDQVGHLQYDFSSSLMSWKLGIVGITCIHKQNSECGVNKLSTELFQKHSLLYSICLCSDE